MTTTPTFPDQPRRPLTWTRRWLYSFLDSYGCGGPEQPRWLLANCAVNVAGASTLDGLLHDAARCARDRAHRDHPAATAPPLEDWDATMGEYHDACAAVDATNAEAAARRRGHVADCVAAAGDQLGAHMVLFEHPPAAQSAEWVDEDDDANETVATPEEGIPLQIRVEHGCRCGHGDWGPDWDAATVTDPVWHTELGDGWQLIALRGAPDNAAVLAAVADAHQVYRDALGVERAAAAARAELADAQTVRSMHARRYRELTALAKMAAPRRGAGRDPGWSDGTDSGALSAASQRLAAAGLHLCRTAGI